MTLHHNPEAKVPWTCSCDYPGDLLVVECPGAISEEDAVEVLRNAGGMFPYRIVTQSPMGEIERGGHLCINHKLPDGWSAVVRG